MNVLVMQSDQRESPEKRESLRFRLQLRLAVIYPVRDGRPVHPIYHAKTHDIGMSGLSMVVDDNVFHEGEVTLLLTLPPVHPWAAQKIIEATARMNYSIHSSKLNAFKIGMKILGFKADGGMLLQAALQRASEQEVDARRQAVGARSGANRNTDSRPRRR